MSTQRGSVREETGISREHIITASELVQLEPYALADCLRELQAHLREEAPEMQPEISSWSGDGLCLLVAPVEQYKEICSELGRYGYAEKYAFGAQKAHMLEAEARKDTEMEPERDGLILVQ